MKQKMTSLEVRTKANDVDEKGRVTVAVNRTGIEDAQGDISMPGSFDATLKTDIARMKWLYNHDITKLLGVPLEGREENGDVIMTGQLNMNKQMCRDVFTDYKLMAEYGRTLEHSVGVIAVRRDKDDRRKVHEWKMLEYSTLSFLGANPCTYLVDLKSATRTQVSEAIEFLQKALEQPEYSDHKLKNIDMNLTLLLKSINGGRIVTCPDCGQVFDYDECEEHTFRDEVLDSARMYIGWLKDDTVREHIESMAGDIQVETIALLDSLKALKQPVTEKSITDIMSFVRCPHCWARVYASSVAPKETGVTSKSTDGKEDEEDNKDPEKDSGKHSGKDESESQDDGKDNEKDEDKDDDDKKQKSFNSFLGKIATKIN